MAIFRFFLGEPSPDNPEFELRHSCRQEAPLQATALHAVLAALYALARWQRRIPLLGQEFDKSKQVAGSPRSLPIDIPLIEY